MILLLLAGAALAVCAWGLGDVLMADIPGNGVDRLVPRVFAGMLWLGCGLLWLSLAMPLGGVGPAVIAGGALLGMWRLWRGAVCGAGRNSPPQC